MKELVQLLHEQMGALLSLACGEYHWYAPATPSPTSGEETTGSKEVVRRDSKTGEIVKGKNRYQILIVCVQRPEDYYHWFVVRDSQLQILSQIRRHPEVTLFMRVINFPTYYITLFIYIISKNYGDLVATGMWSLPPVCFDQRWRGI